MDSTFTYNTASTSTGLLTCYLPDLTKINAAPTTLISTKLNLKINTTSSFSANIFILPTETITTPCNQCFYQGTHSISSGENTIELDLTEQINNPTQYDKNIYIKISPTTSASFTTQGQLTVKVSSERMSNFIDQTVPSQAHSTYDLGKIGSVNVNLRDGSLTFSHTDLALNGGKTAFSLVHTYNSLMYNSDEYVSDIHTQTGHGWKTNYHQFLAGDNAYASYFDATGKEHRFATNNNKIYDTSGLGLYFEKENCKRLDDNNGNLMRFSPYGYLCYIKSNIDNELYVSYEDTGITTTNVNETSSINDSLKNKRIALIENGSERAEFDYKDNLLEKISYTQSDFTSLSYYLYFTYSNNKLTKISKKLANGTESIQAQFEYDTTGRLSHIYGNDYNQLYIKYDSKGRVSKLSHFNPDSGSNPYTSFTYNSENNTTVTSDTGIKLTYTTKENGDLISIVETNNGYNTQLYPDTTTETNKEISQTTNIQFSNASVNIESITKVVSGDTTVNFSPNGNQLKPEDLQATLLSYARNKVNNINKLDFIYNQGRNRICDVTPSSLYFYTSSTQYNKDTFVIENRTEIKGSDNSQYTTRIKAIEEYDTSTQYIKTTTTTHPVNSNGTELDAVSISLSYTDLNGLLKKSVEGNITTEYSHDSFGNVINTLIYSGSDKSKVIKTQTNYSSNGEYVDNSIDENNITTDYTYNLPYNKVTSINALGTNATLGYDSFWENLTSVAINGSAYNSITNEKNRIKTINRGGTNYNFTYDTKGKLKTVTVGSTTLYNHNYTYGSSGNTEVISHPDGTTETIAYNKYGNPSSITANGKTATFTYAESDENVNRSSKDKLYTITDGFSGSTITYSTKETEKDTFTSTGTLAWSKSASIKNGNTVKTYELTGDSHKMSYVKSLHDYAGKQATNLQIRLNPNSDTNAFSENTYKDNFGRVTSKSFSFPGAYALSGDNTYTYNSFTDGSTTRYTNRITNEHATFSYNGTVKSDWRQSYGYGSNGNITTITSIHDNDAKVINYTYDSYNRLIKEENPRTNNRISYEYNSYGNISKKTTTPYNSSSSVIEEFGYDSNFPDLLTSYKKDGTSITISNTNGLPNTIAENTTLTWSRGLLSRFKSTTKKTILWFTTTTDNTYDMTYDVFGKRVKKNSTVITTTSGGNPTSNPLGYSLYYYDGNRLIAERKYTGDGTLDWTAQYLYDDNGITAFKVKPSTSNTSTHTSEYLQDGYFIFKVTTDATGNIVRLDGSNGSMLKIDYDAFGKPYYSNEKSFGYDTNNQYDLKHFFKLGFKGYYYADESGLYYTGSRYYNPVSGRYISPDNVNNMSLTTRGGLSLYNYQYNNPIISNEIYQDNSYNNVVSLADSISKTICCYPHKINTTQISDKFFMYNTLFSAMQTSTYIKYGSKTKNPTLTKLNKISKSLFFINIGLEIFTNLYDVTRDNYLNDDQQAAKFAVSTLISVSINTALFILSTVFPIGGAAIAIVFSIFLEANIFNNISINDMIDNWIDSLFE